MAATYETAEDQAGFVVDRMSQWLKHAQAQDLDWLKRTWLAEQGTGAPWFDHADESERKALLGRQATRRTASIALSQSLKGFKGITEFCEPLLKAELKKTLELDVDVNTTECIQMIHEPLLAGAYTKLEPRIRSLMEAALQNYPASVRFERGSGLAPAGGFAMEAIKGSEALPRTKYVYYKKLNVTLETFATLCHDLDLGAQYQQHLVDVFESPATAHLIRQQSIRLRREQLGCAAQIAWMKRDIGDSAREMLLCLADGNDVPQYNGKAVRVKVLELFDTSVAEVLVIGTDSEASSEVEPVVRYWPGATQCPLKEYESAQAMHDDLVSNLRLPEYIACLSRYVPVADRQRVLNAVHEAVYDVAKEAAGEGRLPREHAKLNLFDRSVSGDVFALLQDAHVSRLKENAKEYAVPSADADEAAAQVRYKRWLDDGLNVLNLAACFVPLLGEVMAVVMAEQLIQGIVDGERAWEEGDRAKIWDSVVSVGLNAAFVVGGAAGGAMVARLLPSETLDGLVKVTLPSGERRLWLPALDGYASEVDLEGVVADAQGVYLVAGRRYVRIEGQSYPVTLDAQGQWRLLARDSSAYQPELVHNGQGSWRLKHDNPLQWSAAKLRRCLGQATEGLSDERLQQAIEATGTDEDQLRQLLYDNAPLPVLLEDALLRARLDLQIEDMLERLRAGTHQPQAVATLPVRLLSQLPGWPDGVVLQVTDRLGRLQEFGRFVAGDSRVASFTFDAVESGHWLRDAQQLLTDAELKTLLGNYLPAQVDARVAALRDKIARFGVEYRDRLLHELYGLQPFDAVRATITLARGFAALPKHLVSALVRRATVAERAQLEARPGRIPLRIAEQARLLLDDLRLDDSLAGLQRGYPQNGNVRRLVFGTLERLPGWSGRVRIEVRQGSAKGTLINSVGNETATEVKYLLEGHDGYQPQDAQEQDLGPQEGLYQALLHALPDRERQALGLRIDEPDRLRRILAQRASQDRPGSAAVLGVGRRRRWLRRPMDLGDGRRGYALSGNPRAAARGMALQSRLRRLCPRLTDARARQILDAMPEAERAPWLERLETQQNQLVQALDIWVEEQPQLTVRRGLMRNLLGFWREQAVGLEHNLHLMGAVEFPELPIAFEHARELHLNFTALTDLPPSLARLFPRLTRLTVRISELTRIPDVVFQMPQLQQLELRGSRIMMDEAQNLRLRGMRNLRELALDGNSTLTQLDLTGLDQLQEVRLNQCALTEWPQGVFELPVLETLDVRENALEQIPPALLALASRDPAFHRVLPEQTYVLGNPLDILSRQHVRSVRRVTGRHVLPDVMVELAFEVPAPLEPVHLWLDQVVEPVRAQRQALWQAVSNEPGSEALFDLLSELRHSAEFHYNHDDLQARVWALLEAAEASTELRDILFEAAAHPQTCSDGAALMFSQLQVRVLVQQALEAGEQADVEARLVALGRGLSRLDRVEAIALRDIAERRANQADPDEAQVRLAYRVGLAQELRLPGQFSDMTYENVWVSEEALENARVAVLEGESADSLREDLALRDFWVAFLRRCEPERFEACDEPYFERLNALDDSTATLSSRQYQIRSETILREREAAQRLLVAELTKTICERLGRQNAVS